MNDAVLLQPPLKPIHTRLDTGWVAGHVRVGDSIHTVILPPKAERTLPSSAWHDELRRIDGALSYSDGLTNTQAMADAGSAIAIVALDKGLYIPARDELECIYRAFKPGTASYNQWRAGDNPSSIPPGYPYVAADPVQTSVDAFRAGGAEAFDEGWYWSSTQHAFNDDYAWLQLFETGGQHYGHKLDSYGVVLVRRELIR